MHEYFININSLTDDLESFSVEFAAGEIDLDQAAECTLTGKISVRASMQRMGLKVLIDGEIQVLAQLVCARCLKAYDFPLKTELMLLAVPIGESQTSIIRQDESLSGMTSEDSNVMLYNGEQFDLMPEIRSALILAIPMKPLCQPDCPGLCPRCAKTLTAGPCDCGRDLINGPFLSLKDLLS